MINLNLLPPSQRAAVMRMITIHLFMALLLFVVVWVGAILVFLGQGWLFLNIQNNALAQRLSVEQSTNTAQETKSFESAAKKTNILLSYAGTIAQKPQDDDAALIVLVSSLTPTAVHLHSLVINSTSGTMTVGGTADTRDALIAFQRQLENQNNYFASVQSPLSNLLSPSNVSFSFLITLKR